MVNLIIKKYGFLGNKQKYKCKKARRQGDERLLETLTTYVRSLPKDFKTPYEYYEDIIKKDGIFSQNVVG